MQAMAQLLMTRSYRLTLALAFAALAAVVGACGSEPAALGDAGTGESPELTPLGTVDALPTATPAGSGASPSLAAWRTDVASGTDVGQAAPNTPVLLRDGSTATLAEVAAGKPVLLYFFATW
jgi:hypothetical protein